MPSSAGRLPATRRAASRSNAARNSEAGPRQRPSPLRLAGAISAVSCIAVTLLTAVSASPGRAAASIGSDKNSIRQLEQLIAHEGDVVQSLVTRADRLEAQLAVTRRHIASARAHLAADRHSVAGARQHLRALAIDAYVDASAAPGSVFQAGSATSADEQQVYLGVASGNIDEAVAALQSDEHRTSVAEGVLKAEDVELTASLQRVGAAQRKAQAAIDEDEAILSHVKGNLLSLVLAANERREAAAEEAEEAQEAKEQAAEAAQNTPPPAPTPTPPPKAPSPPKRPKPKPPAPPPPAPTGGGYANPLRAINALSPERVDQGVDYSGYGPIYAVGDGVVVNTVNGGWPGGTFIVYQLTSGRGAGLFVYAAEDIDPAVSIGEDVTPNTVLGQMYEGPDGIETGWADGSALGETMAAEYGQFDGSNSTAFGYNFSQLLESVGAPGGILQNNPPTGSLPSGWPQW